jgi:Na+/proline symporter
MRLSTQVLGLFSGPLLGMFLLGLLVPRVNSLGVLTGVVIGSLTTLWVNFGWVKLIDGQKVHVSFVWPIVFGVLTTCVVGWIVSFLSSPPSPAQIDKLTYRSHRGGDGL